ncbi:MAG: Histidinol-phosphate aminotransferase 2 [Syntrophaceae bacterium PtaU1.Bin231]|nr:MAG: Histidinol-phosphate aminotransferase 2 [Syntrophaceae bacterium PtaU1.Bin231]HOG16579.1 histidinol-phosphate transaminase [Syntrophales bacterium]
MRPNLDSLVPAYVREFEPYIPSRPDPELKKLYGCRRLFRLNNNENPLGPPPAAQEVIRRFPPPQGAVYPSGDSYYLRQEIAARHGLDPDQILVGNGANEVITFVIKAFCEKGDNIVTADKTFAVYEWVAVFSGIKARVIPLKDETFDDRRMLEAVDGNTKILFVCNPNNPTGTYWTKEKLAAFLDEIGGERIVVVDEAYCEFVEAPDYPDGISLMKEYPNLVVFRTFSKMYGLAALRIGYLAGDPGVVDMIRRTCVVYSVNSIAQEAALAALRDDTDHIGRTRALVGQGRNFLREEMAGMGLPVIANEGNYLIVRLPGSDTLAYRKLMREGVMIRPMTGFRYPNHIRVTLAQMEAMEAFVAALKKILS